MRDVLLVVGFLAFWIALNRWVLPWFGVQTCMGGGCTQVPRDKKGECPDTADKSVNDSFSESK